MKKYRDQKSIQLVEEEMVYKKKPRFLHERSDLFDGLPDDIVISILCKLSSTARCPSDFISILLTCTRLNRLGLHPLVLHKAGPNTLAVRAKNWSDSAHRFLKYCVNSGNIEASYILGMIRFYCLQNQGGGASLMAKAAIKSHAPALHSLAVIQFNGSGGLKNNKDLRAGVALCARAAFLGHIDSLRELGHCFQDGYGVRKNIDEGRRLLIQANARELACVIRSCSNHVTCQSERGTSRMDLGWNTSRDFGWAREVHPANRFLAEWFELGDGKGLRRCSDVSCGRPETRRNEFRRCSCCGKVNYCSRGCQAHDWKVRHKVECTPMPEWEDQDGVDDQTVEVEDIDDNTA